MSYSGQRPKYAVIGHDKDGYTHFQTAWNKTQAAAIKREWEKQQATLSSTATGGLGLIDVQIEPITITFKSS